MDLELLLRSYEASALLLQVLDHLLIQTGTRDAFVAAVLVPFRGVF